MALTLESLAEQLDWRTLSPLAMWESRIDAEEAAIAGVAAWRRLRAAEFSAPRLLHPSQRFAERERRLEGERALFANALATLERAALIKEITNEVFSNTPQIEVTDVDTRRN